MQICILTLGILLAGQISDSGGLQNSEVPAVAPPIAETTDSAPSATQQPSVDQATATQPSENPLRSDNPPSTIPPTAQATLTEVIKPSELLSSLTKPVGKKTLVGVPLTLVEAIQNASSRPEQTQRVTLYWELSQAIAAYMLVSREELELGSLRNGIGLVDSSWEQALEAIVARKSVAQSAVKVAQLRLQNALGRADETNLPLPTDSPHCGAYETKYEQIFRGRSSLEAQELGKLLPLRHEQLRQRANDAAAARQRVIVSQQRSPQGDSNELLRAYEHVALQRRAFIAAAYQYNANIARYTELAVPQEVGAERLVAMLIQTSGNFHGQWQRSSVQQASAEEELPLSDSNGPPRTFVGGDENEARRVPTLDRQGERSILVSPQRSRQ